MLSEIQNPGNRFVGSEKDKLETAFASEFRQQIREETPKSTFAATAVDPAIFVEFNEVFAATDLDRQ